MKKEKIVRKVILGVILLVLAAAGQWTALGVIAILGFIYFIIWAYSNWG